MYMIVILCLGVIRIVVFKFRFIKPYTSDERHRRLQVTEEGIDSAVLDRDPNELVSTTTSFKLKSMDEKKMMEGNRMGNRVLFF